MFANMLEGLKYEVVSTIPSSVVRMPEEAEALEQRRRREKLNVLAQRQQPAIK